MMSKLGKAEDGWTITYLEKTDNFLSTLLPNSNPMSLQIYQPFFRLLKSYNLQLSFYLI